MTSLPLRLAHIDLRSDMRHCGDVLKADGLVFIGGALVDRVLYPGLDREFDPLSQPAPRR